MTESAAERSSAPRDSPSPTRGVRLGTDRVTLADRVAAVLLALPPNAVVSGRTAAILWRLPVPRDGDDADRQIVTVTIPARGPHLRRRGVRVTRADLAGHDVTERHGFPIVTVERAFLELAADLPIPDLVAVGDAALRRGLGTAQSLQQKVATARRRGVRVARSACALLDPRSESPQESRLRAILSLAGLPAPIPQYVVRDAEGGFVARVDLAYPDLRIAIEYDGDHHLTPTRRRADATRRTQLRREGWYVVEIVATDLRIPQRAVMKVTDALAVARPTDQNPLARCG